jgi:hypothetical protein
MQSGSLPRSDFTMWIFGFNIVQNGEVVFKYGFFAVNYDFK